MDNLFSKIKSQVTGNPLASAFDIDDKAVGSAGPNLVWKIYRAKQKTTKQTASVFVFEKKQIEKLNKTEKADFINCLKGGVVQLTRLRHPKILSVLHPLEENRECLSFATEPVTFSLANILGDHKNVLIDMKTQALEELEIKYGLLQLFEALSFLHLDVKLVHSNIHPNSILLNENRVWKLGGFDFAIANSSQLAGEVKHNCPDWRSDILEGLQPELDYLAPERVLHTVCEPKSDMFSVGVLLHALFNNGKPVYQCHQNKSTCKQHIYEIRNVKPSHLRNIPDGLKEAMKSLLSVEPADRSEAKALSKIPYFDDIQVMTLLYIDTLVQRDNLQKSNFFKSLPNVIKQLPLTICIHRVLPVLFGECGTPEMIPFVLQSILNITERATKQQYSEHILPRLAPLMKITQPIQIPFMFMRNMSLLLEKTGERETKHYVLPMILSATEVDNAQLQDLCLNALPSFSHLIEKEPMKAAVIPKIQKLCLSTQQPSTRVKCMLCIGKMLPNMDKWFVLDSILPFVSNLSTKDAATLMTILGIFQTAFTHKNLGIPREILGTKAIPLLVGLSVDHSLSKAQFLKYMTVIKDMLSTLEREHVAKLDEMKANSADEPKLEFAEDSSMDEQRMMSFLKDVGLSNSATSSPKIQPKATNSTPTQPVVKDLTSSLKMSTQPSPNTPKTSMSQNVINLTAKPNVQTQQVKPIQMPSYNIAAQGSTPSLDWSSTSAGSNWSTSSMNSSATIIDWTKASSAASASGVTQTGSTGWHIQPPPSSSSNGALLGANYSMNRTSPGHQAMHTSQTIQPSSSKNTGQMGSHSLTLSNKPNYNLNLDNWSGGTGNMSNSMNQCNTSMGLLQPMQSGNTSSISMNQSHQGLPTKLSENDLSDLLG